MKTRYIIMVIATLAVLTAFSTTASAGGYGDGCPWNNFYNGTLAHGGVYFVSHGDYGGPYTGIFENVPANRTIVRFYPGIWTGSPSGGATVYFSIDINGNVKNFEYVDTNDGGDPVCNIITTPPECNVSVTGCGVSIVRYNNAAPDLVTGNNTITFLPSADIYDFPLLVVYENESMPKIQYWIKEGHEYPDDGTNNYIIYFNETSNTGPIDTTNLQSVDYYIKGNPRPPHAPYLNGHSLESYHTVNKGFFSAYTDIPPEYVNASTNTIVSSISNARAMVAVFVLKYSESATDTEPPYTTGHNPAKGATDVPPDTNIVVHVKDNSTGVDQNTIVMKVDGMEVTPARTGDKYDYTLTYDSLTDFDYGQVVDVTVDAKDLNETPNVMPTDSYSFTIMELEPSTSFFISGWVDNSAGEPVNDPNVTVTNLNTSEIYDVETNESFNYYQVLTCSDNVSAGDVLHFIAIAETTTEFDHEVTAADMNRGGFEQNITIEKTPRPDLVVTELNGYHSDTSCMPWFNLSNEIDVKVENIGDVNAGAFNVSLTIGDGYSAKQNVPGGLNVGENVTLTFTGWKPIGEDCFNNCVFTETYHDYTITGVADCDNDVEERNEENNATTVEERACYNGYTADEPLENVAHGILNGHLNFTTGNGTYGGLYSVGATRATEYEITIPDGASIALAKLNVYYTWHYETSCPQMNVSIANETGILCDDIPLETSYNDMKCHCPDVSWRFPWGNYVYNITDYVTGNGTYIVTVERTGGSSVCIAAPGIVYVYEDENAPTIEYWINEGADILIGGRRSDGGYLAWWESINNATFPASTGTGDVANATLGVVTPWGDGVPDDILFFNEIELGRGVYSGYGNTVDETIHGMSMYIGSTNAQVGVNVTDVKAQYVHDSANMVSQADDGDNTMPSNAFLVVQYEIPGEVITTYDFATNASEDRWAYRYQTNTKPPATNDVPSIEFKTSTNPKKDQYVKISTDNRKMQSDSTNSVDNYAVHRFKFGIAEPVGSIDKIEVLWNGKGEHGDKRNAVLGATLSI